MHAHAIVLDTNWAAGACMSCFFVSKSTTYTRQQPRDTFEERKTKQEKKKEAKNKRHTFRKSKHPSPTATGSTTG